jgi:hypothetical protein
MNIGAIIYSGSTAQLTYTALSMFSGHSNIMTDAAFISSTSYYYVGNA